MDIPRRKLGKTGFEATVMGLGGEGILRTFGYESQAYALINEAIDLGINYFESARAYSGSELYYGLALKERRKQLFLTSKSHNRDSEGARLHLQESLQNMKTDWLDLWQVHDVRSEEDLAMIFGKNGAIEAFDKAKRDGLVRFIGVTGHHDPSILLKAIELYPFDTVLMPVNPAEPTYNSFIDKVLPIALEKGLGIIGMKIYFRGLAQKLSSFHSLEPFMHFALSNPVSTVVVGCDSIEQLRQNVDFAKNYSALSEQEIIDFIKQISPVAKKLMYYKP
jgi:aryl-alcohol dehydrogenase-like predicted oxidoreductase